MTPQFEWYWTASVYEYICVVFALAVNVNEKSECRTMLIISSVNHQHTQLLCVIWLYHLIAYLNLKFHTNFTATKMKLYMQFVIITVNAVYQSIDGLPKYIFIPATLECLSTKNHIWLSPQISEESWHKMQVCICIVLKLVGGYWWCTAYRQINVPLKC